MNINVVQNALNKFSAAPFTINLSDITVSARPVGHFLQSSSSKKAIHAKSGSYPHVMDKEKRPVLSLIKGLKRNSPEDTDS